MSRVLHATGDGESIVKCKEIIDHNLKRFQVMSSVPNYADLTRRFLIDLCYDHTFDEPGRSAAVQRDERAIVSQMGPRGEL